MKVCRIDTCSYRTVQNAVSKIHPQTPLGTRIRYRQAELGQEKTYETRQPKLRLYMRLDGYM